MIGVIQPNDLKQLEKFGNTFKKVDVELLKNKSLKNKSLKNKSNREKIPIFCYCREMCGSLKRSRGIKHYFFHLGKSMKIRFLNVAWKFQSIDLLKKLKKSDMHFRLMEKKFHIFNTTILIRQRKKIQSEKFSNFIENNQFMSSSKINNSELNLSSNNSSFFDIAIKDEF